MKNNRILSFLENKSSRFSFFVEALITLCFLSVIALIVVLSFSFISLAELEMENTAERTFTAVLIAIRSEYPMQSIMSEYEINGVAVYSASGNLLYSEGDVYSRLPVNLFSSMESNSGTSSLLSVDRKKSLIEYIRATSQVVIPSHQGILIPSSDISLIYPNIIYISLGADAYLNQLSVLRIVTFSLMLISILAYGLIVYVYQQNRKYKALLVRQESLVSLGQAIRILTHEIKNPLSVITIQLALLKRTVDKENLEDIRRIEGETKRLLGLTDKISDFLKNPLGNPVRMDVVKGIKDLFVLFEDDVIYEPGSLDEAYILFDSDRFRSVFENLLKNAFEATREEERPEVTVSIRRIKKLTLEIAVKDRGSGIDAKNAKKIFDPFFTTKIHGSGIGLSISMQFVKAAGGKLALRRRSGGGTAAIVTIKEDLVESSAL